MSDFICKFLWKNADVLTDFSVINRVTLRFCSLKGEKYLNYFTLFTFNDANCAGLISKPDV